MGVFRFKITLRRAQASANFALICCGQYLLLVCRDMAIWPLLCPEWLYRWGSGYQLNRFILRSSVLYELHGKFFPERVVRKKTRENTSELRFLPIKQTKTAFSAFFFSVSHNRQRGDYAGKYSINIRPLCESNTHCFGLISGLFPRLLSSSVSLSSIYHVVFLWTPPFCLKLCL